MINYSWFDRHLWWWHLIFLRPYHHQFFFFSIFSFYYYDTHSDAFVSRPSRLWICELEFIRGPFWPESWVNVNGSLTSTVRTWNWPTKWKAAANPGEFYFTTSTTLIIYAALRFSSPPDAPLLRLSLLNKHWAITACTQRLLLLELLYKCSGISCPHPTPSLHSLLKGSKTLRLSRESKHLLPSILITALKRI